jgi:gliding motility-associated lipoprotein GldH
MTIYRSYSLIFKRLDKLKLKLLVFSFFMIGAIALSCKSGVLFDKIQSVPGELWKKESAFSFDVTISDTISPVDYYLTIRNTTDYRFSNLYLFIKTVFPNNTHAKDTVECILANPEGKWYGKGLSRIKENEILLKKAIRFPRKGVYRFEIEQGMRVDPLPGIADIGIRIEKH